MLSFDCHEVKASPLCFAPVEMMFVGGAKMMCSYALRKYRKSSERQMTLNPGPTRVATSIGRSVIRGVGLTVHVGVRYGSGTSYRSVEHSEVNHMGRKVHRAA